MRAMSKVRHADFVTFLPPWDKGLAHILFFVSFLRHVHIFVFKLDKKCTNGSRLNFIINRFYSPIFIGGLVSSIHLLVATNLSAANYPCKPLSDPLEGNQYENYKHRICGLLSKGQFSCRIMSKIN